MQHGVLSESARTQFSRNGLKFSTPEELSHEWTCVKRDGITVPFEPEKIRAALRRCFSAIVAQSDTADHYYERIEKITVAVCAILTSQKKTCPEVEEVQRLVIQQLWSEGLFDAAEHYQNYREDRRKRRLTKAISPEVQARFDEMQTHFPSDMQIYQLMSKFARWDDNLKRRETWKESCYDRVLPWLFKQVPGKLTEAEKTELSEAMYNLEASPAMRVLQMAGPALDRCHVGVFNCAYAPISDIFAFPEMLYILMQGTGQGFSCESDYVSELPRIKKQRGGEKELIVVPDTTEGWCDSYKRGLELWFDGYDCWFDVTGVRKKGAWLKTKGGRSSGPEPFLELMTFARNMLIARQGRFLEDTDVHRLCCFTGRIVQVGGVRRAALLSLSDLDSVAMRNIKSGAWYGDNLFWENGKYLSMSNNSAVYNERPTTKQFMEEFLALVKSDSGERGIFNREAVLNSCPSRRKRVKFGVNPCAEIILPPNSFCNLSIAIARRGDTAEILKRKVRIATIFGVIQSTCTNFGYIRPDWKKNCEEERLLGVDITGQADCELLQFGAPGRDKLLQELKEVVAKTRHEYAMRFGITDSAADTCGKPGGDSAVLFDCGSGISDRYADYQIRWCRESIGSPIANFLIDSGVPYAPSPEAPDSLLVFGFPRESPPGSTTRNSHTAIQQLEMWLESKINWAEHSISVTIHVEEHEWPEVMAWVFKPDHWDHLTGVSFQPKDNGVYTYPPNEELTEEKYREFKAKFPKLNWAKLTHYEDEDQTESSQAYACADGRCSF